MVIAVTIGMGRMEIEEGNWMEVAFGRGFAEVVNNRVTLLVDTAEKPEEIDIRHAQEQKERAEERIRQKQSIQEYYGFHLLFIIRRRIIVHRSNKCIYRISIWTRGQAPNR